MHKPSKVQIGRCNFVLQNVVSSQGDQKILKNCQNFQLAQTVAKSKKGQSIYNKAQFKSPEHLHQTTFETLNSYNKPCFLTAYLGKCNKFAQTKSFSYVYGSLKSGCVLRKLS